MAVFTAGELHYIRLASVPSSVKHKCEQTLERMGYVTCPNCYGLGGKYYEYGECYSDCAACDNVGVIRPDDSFKGAGI